MIWMLCDFIGVHFFIWVGCSVISYGFLFDHLVWKCSEVDALICWVVFVEILWVSNLCLW